jgi:putative NADPH-quinone reductase
MKTTLVLAHPWHGSFNKAILDTVIQRLEEKSKSYQLIDLNKDKFNPVLEEQDLALYSRGKTTDQHVLKYQQMLKDSDELVFIFPIWWFEIPAIFKGFIDKVMLKDFAWVETKTGLKGLLTHINKTTIITTSEVPNWYLRYIGGNYMRSTFRTTLKGIGLKKVKWINSDYTASGKREKKVNFLKKVKNIF